MFKDNPLAACELKFSDGDDATGEFEGYASVFNSNDAVNDTIEPGAFEKSLSKANPAMFINHDHRAIPVGDWLDLKEDEHGLFGVGKIDMHHADGPSAYSALKRGAMTGLSIGFTMGSDDFTRKEAGGRLIKSVDLMEVSLVTFPCEDNARISSVKADDLNALEDLRAVENYLRDVGGFSKAAAIALVGRIKRLARSDSEPDVGKSLTDDLTNFIKGIKL